MNVKYIDIIFKEVLQLEKGKKELPKINFTARLLLFINNKICTYNTK